MNDGARTPCYKMAALKNTISRQSVASSVFNIRCMFRALVYALRNVNILSESMLAIFQGMHYVNTRRYIHHLQKPTARSSIFSMQTRQLCFGCVETFSLGWRIKAAPLEMV